MESFNSITGTEKASQKNKWLCKQEMYNKFGKEEADEMIENNFVDERINPQNVKRKQWKVREDAVAKVIEKKKELKAFDRWKRLWWKQVLPRLEFLAKAVSTRARRTV